MSDFIDSASPDNPYVKTPAKAEFVDSTSPANPYKSPEQNEPSPSLLNVFVNGVKALRSGEPTPENRQAAERLSEIPRNGIRALTVGAENLIQGKSGQEALNRADAAASPTYQTRDGERLADFAANAADPRFLPIAELKLVKNAGLIGKAMNGAVQGGVGGAAATALDAAANKENIDPEVLQHNAGLGATIAGPLAPLIHAVAELPGTSEKVAKMAFNTYRRFAGADPVAANAIYDNLDRVNGAKGTPESQQAAADKLRDLVSTAKSTPGQAYQAAREEIVPPVSPDQARAFELSKPQGYDQPKAILGRAHEILSMPVPKNAPADIQRNYAAALIRSRDEIGQLGKFNPQERLNVGINPDQSFWDGQYKSINDRLDQLPIAQKFRAADADYSEGATAFDALKNKFSTRGSANAAVQESAMAKPLSSPEARAVDVNEAIKQVPGAEAALEDAKNEVYKRALQNPTSMIDRNAHKGFMSDIFLPWMKEAVTLSKGAGKAARAAFAIPAAAGQVADTDAARGLMISGLSEAEKKKKD